MNQDIKKDAGKLRISLVPPQIIRDISEVRMYGQAKYGTSESWRMVEPERYIDALLRHTLAFMEDPQSVDEESGIKHYKHMACNMAFLCEMFADEEATAPYPSVIEYADDLRTLCNSCRNKLTHLDQCTTCICKNPMNQTSFNYESISKYGKS